MTVSHSSENTQQMNEDFKKWSMGKRSELVQIQKSHSEALKKGGESKRTDITGCKEQTPFHVKDGEIYKNKQVDISVRGISSPPPKTAAQLGFSETEEL